MKKVCFFLFLILSSIQAFAQIENIDSQENIYKFLKILQLKGVIENFDDIILPLTKSTISKLFLSAEANPQITTDELCKIEFYRRKFELGIKEPESIIGVTGAVDFGVISLDSPKYLYFFKDSSTKASINFLFENKFIASKNKRSDLLRLGGRLKVSYSNWMGASFAVMNGTTFGDRELALVDNFVKQSFTFNHTKIDFFDNTEGYLRLEKGKVSFQIGRERVLWGRGLNRVFLSNNPPIFDHIRFNADFEFFNFNYLHGWLVQPAYLKIDPVLNNYVKNKNPKYIVLSRFGISPSRTLSFGFTQSIIYANRPLEAAYLNPFLFLESAQRSLEDLDNSFLGFDLSFLPLNGMEISSEIIFDDINFGTLFSYGFGSAQNRYTWETQLSFASPILPENFAIYLNLLIIRPYMYSHYEVGESLLYTNNSYFLGPDIQPNSIKYSILVDYFVTPRLILFFKMAYSIHGDNTYDDSGALINNYGGNIYDFLRLTDSRITNLLEGVKEYRNNINFSISYEFIIGSKLNLGLNLYFNESKSTFNNNFIYTSISYGL